MRKIEIRQGIVWQHSYFYWGMGTIRLSAADNALYSFGALFMRRKA